MAKQIIEVGTEKTTLVGTEMLEMQEAAGGIGSSKRLSITTILGFIQTALANTISKASSAVQSVVAGTNILVDTTDPTAPKVSTVGTLADYTKVGQFTKSQTVSPIVNNNVVGAITPDCSTTNTFEYTITGNTTINNPINTLAGQFINFLLIENATGGYTITLGANFKIMNGTGFVTTPNTVNILSGYVANNGIIYCNISQ